MSSHVFVLSDTEIATVIAVFADWNSIPEEIREDVDWIPNEGSVMFRGPADKDGDRSMYSLSHVKVVRNSKEKIRVNK